MSIGLVFFMMSCQIVRRKKKKKILTIKQQQKKTLEKLPLHVKNVDIHDFILKKLELDSYLLIQDLILCMIEDDPKKRISSKECESKLNKLRQRTKKKTSSLLSLRNYKEERNSSPQPQRDFQEISDQVIELDEKDKEEIDEEEEEEEEKKKRNNRLKRQSLSVKLQRKKF